MSERYDQMTIEELKQRLAQTEEEIYGLKEDLVQLEKQTEEIRHALRNARRKVQ